MDVIHVLALLAGAMNISAFLMYNRDALAGPTKPNAAAWLVWAVVMLVQVLSYRAMSVHWTELVVMCSDSSLCVLTFAFLLWKGRFGKLDMFGQTIIGLSLLAVIAWQSASSAALGNVLSQIPYAMAFLPIARDLRSGRSLDPPLVWSMFTASFVVNLVVVYLKQPENPIEYLFPLVTIVMHSMIVAYAVRGRRKYAAPAKIL